MKNVMVIKLFLTVVSRKRILNVWLVQEHKTYSLLTFAAQSKRIVQQITSTNKSFSLYKRAPLKIVFDTFPQHRVRRPQKQDSTAAGNVQPGEAVRCGRSDGGV